MKIYFSNQGKLRYFSSFLERLDFSNPEKLEIFMNEHWVNVHPAHLVLTAALAKKVGRDNSHIISDVPRSAMYLDRMGLYNLVETPSPFDNYDHKESSGRFIPITFIKDSASQTKYISDIVPLLHLNENDARIIRYIVGELIRNVLEHSLSKDGAAVAAQYYKNTNHISLAICDTGIGLKRGLNIWHPVSDEKAIQLALTPGVSGETISESGTSDNAGAGLFFIKSIAKMTRNNFVIYSGDSAYILKKTRPDQKVPTLKADPFDDSCIRKTNLANFQGTLVAIDMSLNATIEFRQILDKIGEIYDVAIKERRARRYRKPNFIQGEI